MIKDIKALDPSVAVLVFTMHDEGFYAERALRAGARGYIMKRETTQRSLAGSARCWPAGFSSARAWQLVGAKICGRQAVRSSSPVKQLSDRELEVFQLLGKGYETRQVAESLKVSMKTVQAHCAHIKEKLNLTNASELLREAVRWHENYPLR